MIDRIHILGAAGSGTTTLGEALSLQLGYQHFDTDHYFWIPTDPPFQVIREREARIKALAADLANARQWILTGSLCGWGDGFIPGFDLVIFLWIPKDLRIARLIFREKQRYGETEILAGGKMYQTSRDFIEWAGKYDDGDLNIRSKALHEQWLARLKCKVLKLEGDLTIKERVGKVIRELSREKS